MISIHVPAMTGRRCVRAISARVHDVPGVQTLEVDLATKTIHVTGPADPTAVAAAIEAAGYAVQESTGTTSPAATTPAGGTMDNFSTAVVGLPGVTRPPVVELTDGESFHLQQGPVAKQLRGTTVRMLGYNGSVPGPTIKVRQGSEVVIHVTNETDIDTTVHWHGLRVENKYDGVPHETQEPIPVAGSFTYRLQFPDPGLYWYHPHIREDYAQEMGLYGNILVEPLDPDYWPPAHRDVVLPLDDILIEDGAIAPFSRTETTFSAMGRFGNVLLVAGEPDLALTASAGEVVRLWLTNTANTRVFNVTLPGARMKLIGGDSGRVEREEFVSEVLIAPSERAIVDVLLDRPGELTLEHRTPDHIYQLASISVTNERAAPPLRDSFELLRHAPEFEDERQQLDGWLAAAPDKILAAVAEMEDPFEDQAAGPVAYACPMHPDVVRDQPGHCPKCGMKLMSAHPGELVGGHDMGHAMFSAEHVPSHAQADGHGDGHGDGGGDGIEWEDDMVEMNRRSTTTNMRWRLVDRTAGSGDRPPVDWRFTVGERVKIRLVNEMESDHPMHHPIHLHGAGRFLVLGRDGVPERNLVWKDTVLMRTGQTVDILFDVSNPGLWMAHCHIAEHMHSGMMFSFTVKPLS
ncbi:Heavy-metal-associated domain-containing protein [Blastococcus aurantiacus]|uniref:Heavy-metal-associated domain-containing protein n=1 Tax=Blastococcus aurantiacus TaxID=1550231 RepID=A0A1G7R3C3_9ACTN|nr:multicopper oxidase domain-containing protein [Blastococcus aurantiacus]SDG05263.1 Heavy-metal-associated domain-containing protein [Blastococcus aurantiacus]